MIQKKILIVFLILLILPTAISQDDVISKEEITLDEIKVDSKEEWHFGKDNIIELEAYDKKDNKVELSSVEVNINSTEYDVEKILRDKGEYELKISIEKQDIEEVSVEVIANQGGKEIREVIDREINDKGISEVGDIILKKLGFWVEENFLGVFIGFISLVCFIIFIYVLKGVSK